MALENLNQKDIREQVFEQLLKQITTGVWKAGDKLPSENEMASALGVSRISIREAIQKLAAIDLVETYRGKGSFVKEFTTNNYLKSLTPMLLMSKSDILYVVEYRRILEIGIIDLFMRHVEQKDIQVLKKCLEKMKQHHNNLKKYAVYDLDFHLKLYEMTHNPFITKISNMISDIINTAMEGSISERGAEEGIEFHTQILQAIEAGDAPKLKEITNALFDQIELEIHESME